MENLPFYIPFIFVLSGLLGLFLFYRAANYSKKFLALVIVWIAMQTIPGLTGFYDAPGFPPRVALLVLPPLLLIIIMFVTAKGRLFIDQLDIKALTLFHVFRIFIELVLYMLYLQKFVPELMTFSGRNFDILSGISAPIVYYFGYVKQKMGKTAVLAWNIVCLLLVLNILVNGLLSAPTPIQQFGFDQPNIAITKFPFIFLPGMLVPLVIFAHLAAIRQILKRKD